MVSKRRHKNGAARRPCHHGLLSHFRVFIDADALLAGSASATAARHLILQLGGSGLIQVVACQQVRGRSSAIWRGNSQPFPTAFGLQAQAAIRWVGDPSPGDVDHRVGRADPKDLRILVAAIRERCAYPVTFNVRHYQPSTSIRVEKPGEFVLHLRECLATLAE